MLWGQAEDGCLVDKSARHPQYKTSNVKKLVQSHLQPKPELRLGLSDFKAYTLN